MLNRYECIGNITDELEIKKTPTNKTVLEFTVAVNEGYGDKQTTSYIPVQAWENLASNIATYCRKGYKIFVEGKFKTDTWEREGKKHYKSYILATNVGFLQPKIKETREQTSLTGDDTDLLGHKLVDNKVEIETDDLPFY